MSAALAYTRGVVSLYAVQHRREHTTLKDHAGNSLFVVKLNLDTVAVSVAHARNLGFGGARGHDSLVGMTVPFGRHKLLGSVIVHRDRLPVSGKAQQYGIAYVYSLSKRTELYAAYAHINNHSATRFTVGNGTDVGSGDTATNLGIRHNF
jgi:predicted porin